MNPTAKRGRGHFGLLAATGAAIFGVSCTNVVVDPGDVTQISNQTSDQNQNTGVDQTTGVDTNNTVVNNNPVMVNVNTGDPSSGGNNDVDDNSNPPLNDGSNEPPNVDVVVETGDKNQTVDQDIPDDQDDMQKTPADGDVAATVFNDAFGRPFSVFNTSFSAASVISDAQGTPVSVQNTAGGE